MRLSQLASLPYPNKAYQLNTQRFRLRYLVRARWPIELLSIAHPIQRRRMHIVGVPITTTRQQIAPLKLRQEFEPERTCLILNVASSQFGMCALREKKLTLALFVASVRISTEKRRCRPEGSSFCAKSPSHFWRKPASEFKSEGSWRITGKPEVTPKCL